MSLDPSLVLAQPNIQPIPQWLPAENRWESLAYGLFRGGSWLTEPACRMREHFWRARIVDELDGSCCQKIFYFASALFFGSCAIFTTLPGMLLRWGAISLLETPYFHWQTDAPPKAPDDTLSLFLWNVCGPAGGYAITDGGVLPWRDRFPALIETIESQDADVVILQEVFESDMAFALAEECRKLGYCDLFCHIDSLTVGVPSGVFVASRRRLANPNCERFPRETLVGRTKNAAKGVFSFDVMDGERPVAHILTTHLQQSDESAYPREEEMRARALEMAIVLDKVDRVAGRAVILAGDLNMQRSEFENQEWRRRISIGNQTEITWGGDASCAEKVGQRASGPLQMDYIGYFDDSAEGIETGYVDPRFNPQRIEPGALSDHWGIRSVITLRQ